MSTNENLMEQVKAILIERSKKSIELSKQAVLEEQIKYEPLHEALRYFLEEIWFDVAHPALLSLTCEAVGGKPDSTTGIGAALVLLAGAADIHDDIIDQSTTKDSKPTVFGKYGKDTAIIAGDVLWFKGMLMLNEACEMFSIGKKQAILKLAKQSFFDIGSAEAKEANLRGNLDLQPEEYLEIIKMKVSVAEAAAQIGAIIGNGTAEQIENFTRYGKTLGFLMTIRDEFIDMFEPGELKNRFKNECLPLPILYAFQDDTLKKEIIGLLEQEKLTETESDKIIEIVINTSKVRKLLKDMRVSVKEATQYSLCVKKNRNTFVQLLESTLENL